MAGIDACPMEGFDKGAFDNILNLKELGVTSYALCAIGYRGESDWVSKVKKVRFAKEEVIVEVK
jgi:nitroreductase